MLKYLFLLLFATSIVISCKKESKTPAPLTHAKAYTPESESAVYKYIKSLGFSTSQIKDSGSHYLVENQLLFDKNHPPKNKGTSTVLSEQYSTSNLVSYTLQSNITVAFDYYAPPLSEYGPILDAAMDLWNNVPNCKIHFSRWSSSSSQGPNITIHNYASGICNSGLVHYPMDGQPGADLYCSASGDAPAPTAQKIARLAQQLGYTIGLRASNWIDDGEPQIATGAWGEIIAAMHIMGTPPGNDPASILNITTCTTHPTSLSSYDIAAMQFLYPSNPPVSGAVPVFRYYSNSTTQDHFYTTLQTELGNGSNSNYIFEGIGFFAHSTQVSGSVPVFRYSRASTGDHHYTANFSELGYGASGYTYEGIAFYAFSSQVANTVPIYRYNNATVGDHFFTKNGYENTSGYTYEGVAFYAY